MLKVARKQLWTCSSCLARIQRRNAATVATAAAGRIDGSIPTFAPASLAQPSATQDDQTLRKVFDSKDFWQDFSRRGRDASARSAGIVRNRYLATPEGFMVYAQQAMQKCSRLVQKTLAMQSTEDYRCIVQDLDRLSDLLCRVIDLSDFIRATHPNRSYQHAASLAYSAMFEYMNQLNTMTGLNEQLKKAAGMPEVYNSWSEEEQTVANILLKDFNKSAIDLSDQERQKFVELSNDIADSGTEFTDHMAPQDFHLRFRAAKLKGLHPVTIKNNTRFGMAMIPTTGPIAAATLASAEDPDVRRDVFMAHRTASRNSINKLEQMLKYRSELASLAGYESYGHLALFDKMAKSPAAVNKFLQALKQDTQPIIQAELQQLLDLKSSDAHSNNFPNVINAWDKDYYVQRLLSGMSASIRTSDVLSSYFSLGTVFQGLSRLFTRTYGLRLSPAETLPGETWHDEVRRLNVVNDNSEVIAVIYCDLFARPGKSPNPAHFTLRCSRIVSQQEIEECANEDNPFSDPIAAATEGLAFSTDKRSGTVRQLPTIALICDFNHPSSSLGRSSTPSLLSLRDVQTLFHEMGHALHSILGRTALQNVSGTRCATDLAELPSVLMEYFAFAPEVLGLWARHWESDRPLAYALVEERLQVERRMQGLETEAQIMMALLDQALHAQQWHKDSALSSTVIYHQVYSSATLPEPQYTAWQGFFGHLYGYGATYYSYLFARAVAGRVWRQVFADGQLSIDRGAGEKFKQELLQWGGSRDGWKCIAGVLDNPRLASGDQAAMEMVGKWGVRGEIDF